VRNEFWKYEAVFVTIMIYFQRSPKFKLLQNFANLVEIFSGDTYLSEKPTDILSLLQEIENSKRFGTQVMAMTSPQMTAPVTETSTK